jgi:polysaccharide export outer membrane protein
LDCPNVFDRRLISLRLLGKLSVLVVAAALAACTSAPDLEAVDLLLPRSGASSQIGSSYRIQIGDQIDVFVLEDSSFNGTFMIRPSGDIIMPKVGRVPLLGMSLAEAENGIKQTLQGSQLRQATVIVDPGMRGDSGGGLTVRLSGEVTHTGRVTVRPLGDVPVSAYQAVVDSGGFKMFANRRKGYILRRSAAGVTRIGVNFEEVEKGSAVDPPLQEGDFIVVPKKGFGF